MSRRSTCWPRSIGRPVILNAPTNSLKRWATLESTAPKIPQSAAFGKSPAAPLVELLPLHDSLAFADHHQLIRRHSGDGFARAVRPADLQRRRTLRAEAEMQPRIARGIEAGLTEHFLRL